MPDGRDGVHGAACTVGPPLATNTDDGFATSLAGDLGVATFTGSDGTTGERVEALRASGSYAVGDRLRPAEDARTVRVRGGERIVVDGPSIDGSGQVAGFDIVEADDLDAAIAIASEHPMARFGLVEVQPVWPF
ncbi:hypothetical protein C5D09_07155 [Rathayibacter sp. AY1C9]|jgi:hypothetical protein|uniref:YciI family protein n=1 Tax=unclassified Rathayibacter TaxID=2609250 RepID=UPI000CE8E22C|nr:MULTISPECIES: YciI family protein [unclassified Rathayibacter]PPH28808.1 hypothetical protein C5C37_09775 [Rathayibacter sp. AY1F9]PPH46715.1 hypothetical protein C5D09_07155 [Rathayibacter sp. AY1C9]